VVRLLLAWFYLNTSFSFEIVDSSAVIRRSKSPTTGCGVGVGTGSGKTAPIVFRK
jgi:hypothetical protein